MGWQDDNVQIDRIILTNDINFDPSQRKTEKPTILYPNPAIDDFIIEFFSDSADQVEVRIWDVSGKLVRRSFVPMSIGLNKIQVPISDLSNGFYIVSLLANSKQKYSSKLIVLH